MSEKVRLKMTIRGRRSISLIWMGNLIMRDDAPLARNPVGGQSEHFQSQTLAEQRVFKTQAYKYGCVNGKECHINIFTSIFLIF